MEGPIRSWSVQVSLSLGLPLSSIVATLLADFANSIQDIVYFQSIFTVEAPNSPWQNHGKCASGDEVCGNGKMPGQEVRKDQSRLFSARRQPVSAAAWKGTIRRATNQQRSANPAMTTCGKEPI